MYSDVDKNAWYNHSVGLAATNGLMNGSGAGKFDPDGTMTVAQVLAISLPPARQLYNGGNRGLPQGNHLIFSPRNHPKTR
jgi:hypothetical protein